MVRVRIRGYDLDRGLGLRFGVGGLGARGLGVRIWVRVTSAIGAGGCKREAEPKQGQDWE
jgi:hypothetical protein